MKSDALYNKFAVLSLCHCALCRNADDGKGGECVKRNAMKKFRNFKARAACILALSFIFTMCAPSMKVIADDIGNYIDVPAQTEIVSEEILPENGEGEETPESTDVIYTPIGNGGDLLLSKHLMMLLFLNSAKYQKAVIL